tara:strand:- start:1335 stop:1877 length:543 start_codon:yes stop_codon:yes gene_type:complete
MDKIVLHEVFFHHGRIEGVNNKELVKHILKTGKSASEDETDSYHEDTDFPTHKELEKILRTIVSELSKYYKGKISVSRYWSQIHLPNQSTTLHDHLIRENMSTSPTFSGVYYLQCDAKSGYFVFQHLTDDVTMSRWKIKPEVGKFIIFPSYIPHFVTRNYSKKNRISISFNFNIEGYARI